jgi:hypothetical protein
VEGTNEILVETFPLGGRRPANAGLTAEIPPRPEDAEKRILFTKENEFIEG